MPNFLPKNLTSSVLSLDLKRSQYFPSIFRIFPEKTIVSKASLRLLVMGLLIIISAGLFFSAMDQYELLNKNRQYLKTLTAERTKLEKEVAYWKKIAGNYSNYPDIYLKIASLEYRLGDSYSAKSYINKALSMNPELEQGRVLGAQISR